MSRQQQDTLEQEHAEEFTEEWRPVVGYEGVYSVSSFGVVRSERRAVEHSCGKVQIVRERILKPAITAGYLCVNLARNGKNRTRTIHQLVLEAFVGPRPEGCQACHNDGNRHNNKSVNLRWDTPLNNSTDRVLHGTFARGERAGGAKLNADLIAAMRALRRVGVAYHKIGAKFGVSHMTVLRATRGETYK